MLKLKSYLFNAEESFIEQPTQLHQVVPSKHQFQNYLIQSSKSQKVVNRNNFFDAVKTELRRIRGEPTFGEIRKTIHQCLEDYGGDHRNRSVDDQMVADLTSICEDVGFKFRQLPILPKVIDKDLNNSVDKTLDYPSTSYIKQDHSKRHNQKNTQDRSYKYENEQKQQVGRQLKIQTNLKVQSIVKDNSILKDTSMLRVLPVRNASGYRKLCVGLRLGNLKAPDEKDKSFTMDRLITTTSKPIYMPTKQPKLGNESDSCASVSRNNPYYEGYGQMEEDKLIRGQQGTLMEQITRQTKNKKVIEEKQMFQVSGLQFSMNRVGAISSRLYGATSRIEEKIQPFEVINQKSHSIQQILNTSTNRREVIYYDDPKFPRDTQFQERYATLRTFYSILNLANGLFVQEPPGSGISYRAFIGKGNNGIMVKALIKSRWWWQVIDSDLLDSNFAWTQLKNRGFMKILGSNSRDTLLPIINQESESSQQSKPALPANKNAIDYKRVMTAADYVLVLPFLNSTRIKLISLPRVRKLKVVKFSDPQSTKCHNHVANNFNLGTKKALFYNMRSYYESLKRDVFCYLPLTFHISNSQKDPQYHAFLAAYKERPGSIWIIKPGELTNRGHGIRVSSNHREILDILNSRETHKNGKNKTFIVQKYLEKPLLYNKRKFDIRCFMLFTSINGNQKGFWYQDGYIRTSSKEFSTKNLSSKMVHLTNDAVQKRSEDYGRYEKGNKVSFQEFQIYMDSEGTTLDFMKEVYPKMRSLAQDSLRAAYGRMDPSRRENSFELFGLDFMIDEDFNVWLIEINTNPCLETSSPLLMRIIPALIENTLRLTIDPIYPPPHFYNNKRFLYNNPLEQNKFDLIFDEHQDAHELVIQRQNIIIDQMAEEDEGEDEIDSND